MQADLTQARLKEVLHYDPDTGVFVSKLANGRWGSGRVVGYIMPKGYRLIQIDGVGYLAHRLAWLWMTGRFPPAETDHVNGVRDDNRFANLREATRSENAQNSKRYANNTSGANGVSYDNRKRKWRAYISVEGKRVELGLFRTVDDAQRVQLSAKAKLHTFQPTPRDR